MNNAAQHYVYEWVRPDYDVVFWVGKGIGRRAWEFKRNDHTNKVIAALAEKGLKPQVRILARFLTKGKAFEFEIERIAFWEPLGELTNKTKGGDCGPVMYGNDNPMSRPEVYAKYQENLVRGENHWWFGKEPWNKGLSLPQQSGPLNPMSDPVVKQRQLENIPRGENHPMKRPEVLALHREIKGTEDFKDKHRGDKNAMRKPEVKSKHLEVVNSPDVKAKQIANTPRGSTHYMKDPARKAAALAKRAAKDLNNG
jgi:hypothetical protein